MKKINWIVVMRFFGILMVIMSINEIINNTESIYMVALMIVLSIICGFVLSQVVFFYGRNEKLSGYLFLIPILIMLLSILISSKIANDLILFFVKSSLGFSLAFYGLWMLNDKSPFFFRK